MTMDLIIFILPMAVLAAGINTRGGLRDYWPAAKALLVSFVEWFGELGMFCGRLIRAVFVPPYEIQEIIRQMDNIGAGI